MAAIQLLGQVPHKINIAFSGGVDSLAAAHFFKQGKRDITLLHFNHGCEFSDQIEAECRDRAAQLGLPIRVGHIDPSLTPPTGSQEAFWRKERYTYLKGYNEAPTLTCHHLDDAVETWVWSSLHGEPKLIPPVRGNFIRPLLLTKKNTLVEYADRNNLVPVADPFNECDHVMRNYMRRHMTEHVYHINPGIDKVIRKKYLTGKFDK